jgi:tetratricopeptide (TPR) repeat protein
MSPEHKRPSGGGRPRPSGKDIRRRETSGYRGRKPDREPAPDASKYEPAHLEDELVRDLIAAARPGKGEILVKVFADALGAFAAGDLDEALRLADQSKHIALRSTHAREFLGIALYEAGRYKEAATELSAFRRLSGSTEQNPLLADCYRALQKPEKAIDICSEIDVGKVGPQIYYEGAIVAAGALAEMGKLDAAIAQLERLDLEPAVAEEHHVRAWYALGNLLELKGKFTQARSWFEAAASADGGQTDAAERSARIKA